MTKEQKKSRTLEFVALFVIAYLLSQVLMKTFFPSQTPNAALVPVAVVPAEQSIRQGNTATVTIENNTDSALKLPGGCPMPPFEVFRVDNPGQKTENLVPLKTKEAVDCVDEQPVTAGEKRAVNLSPWKYSLFWDIGTYELRLPNGVKKAADNAAMKTAQGSGAALGVKKGTGAVLAGSGTLAATTTVDPTVTRLTVYEPGVFVKLFRTIITKPFLNFLVFIADITPGHSLGFAILLLTLIVKLILYYPTQKSLEGQRKMQVIQPKLDELKKKHKGDQTTLHQETMKLWKEHNVNPFASCLPILFQLPVLIGLFYVIQDGTHLALSQEYLYPMYDNLPWAFSTRFLGMDLTKPEIYVMPVLLFALQFWQMKLSFARKKKENAKKVVDAKTGKEEKPEKSPEEIQQQVMVYALPAMIAFFAFQFPAAVALYYGMSTVFAIGQQLVVNKKWQ